LVRPDGSAFDHLHVAIVRGGGGTPEFRRPFLALAFAREYLEPLRAFATRSSHGIVIGIAPSAQIRPHKLNAGHHPHKMAAGQGVRNGRGWPARTYAYAENRGRTGQRTLANKRG